MMNRLREWIWPLSMGLLSGLWIVAILYEPDRKADITVNAPLCTSLRESGWIVEASGQSCLLHVKYQRAHKPFMRIKQDGRALQINTAEVLAILNR